MKTEKIDKSDWGDYFNRLAKAFEGKNANINIMALNIGDQIEAEKVKLLGITYDSKGDLFEIALEGLDHIINHPKEVQVLIGSSGIEAIEIISGEGRKQIVELTDPLMLERD